MIRARPHLVAGGFSRSNRSKQKMATHATNRRLSPAQRSQFFQMHLQLESVWHEPLRALAARDERPMGWLAKRFIINGIRQAQQQK
jgi:hypothetical protein